MHILALPKWYPGQNDPQLGDFIRKQMLAVATVAKVSVVYSCPVRGMPERYRQERDTSSGAWELRCYYRPSTSGITPWRKLVNLARWWKATRAGIDRCLREQGRPDLVHVHILVRPALAALWLRRSAGIPFIISEQSSQYLDGSWAARSAIAKRVARYLFRQAAAVTAVSEHLGEGMRNAGFCDRIDVVPNTIPGMDRPLPPEGQPDRFMMVADLVDRTKNVSGVLRALKAARAEGVDARLDVIGDGPDGPELRALARSLGLNGSVTWHGQLPNSDVLDRMGTTGVVIINSNVETFSVVTGEALVQGKPVIATRCGGPQGFVTGSNGVLIPVKDDAALKRAIISFSRREQRFDPAVVRRSVSDRFGPAAIAAGFMSIYQRVLAE